MRYKHRRFILQWTPGMFLIAWLKRVRFNKYENVSLYKIMKLFFQNLMDDEIMDRANGVAFNFILAIFPAIIFLFTLIPNVTPFFPDISQESILSLLGENMPASMFDVIAPTVKDIVGNQRGGLLSLGFVFSLWLSTNGTLALMRAFNACYRTVDRRSSLKARLIATGLTFNLAFVVILAIALLVIGQFILHYLMQFEWLTINAFTVFLLFTLR